MHKIRKLMRLEMDVELFSCAHSITMIFFYGIIVLIAGEKNVRIMVLFEMMALGYISAWTQKALFLREHVYSRAEYVICEVLWNIMPSVFVPVFASVFGWFDGMPEWAAMAFYIIMACYFVLVWLFLRFIHYEETVKMNRQLKKRRKKGGKGDEDGDGTVASDENIWERPGDF